MRLDECLLLLSSTGKILWASKPATRMLGCTQGDTLAMTLPLATGGTGSKDDRFSSVVKALESIAAGVMNEAEGDAHFSDKANRRIAAHWKLSVLPVAPGDFRVLLAISESSKSSSAVPKKDGIQDAFATAAEGVLRLSAEGRLIEANPACASMFGFDSPGEMIRKVNDGGGDLFADSARRADFLLLLERIGLVEDFELEFLKADKTVLWVIAHARSMRDPAGRIHFFEGSLIDITRQKRAEQESERSRIQLRELTARLQDVREEERTSIARELHDDLGQALTLLTLDLAWLRERLLKTVPDEVQKPLAEKIETMEQTIQTTLDTVRRILSALRPPLLDELGLKDAIEFQVQEFSKRAGMRYELNAKPMAVTSEKTRIAVFRIFQEILTNVARHARASRVKVDLAESDSALVLIVEDNGCGISHDQMAESKGFGIVGIRERAWGIGGEVEFQRASGSGTRVTLRVPLKNEPPGAVQPDSIPAGGPQTEFPFEKETATKR